jgi:hypothetical protein
MSHSYSSALMTCDLHITKNNTHFMLLKQERNSFHPWLACRDSCTHPPPPSVDTTPKRRCHSTKSVELQIDVVMLVYQRFRSVSVAAPELWNTICTKSGLESDLGEARMALQTSWAGEIPLIKLGDREGEQRLLGNMHTAGLEVDNECKLVRNPPYPPGYASIESHTAQLSQAYPSCLLSSILISAERPCSTGNSVTSRGHLMKLPPSCQLACPQLHLLWILRHCLF